jgi:hypothetical protein
MDNEPAVNIVDLVALGTQLSERREELAALAKRLRPLGFDKDNLLHLDYIEGYVVSHAHQTGIPVEACSRMDYMRLLGDSADARHNNARRCRRGIRGATNALHRLAQGEEPAVFGIASLNGLNY